MGNMNAEARARLHGEAEFLKRHAAEFDKLVAKKGRNAAIVTLVTKHKNEYGEIVKGLRDRFDAEQAA